jgi:hypothetical protein
MLPFLILNKVKPFIFQQHNSVDCFTYLLINLISNLILHFFWSFLFSSVYYNESLQVPKLTTFPYTLQLHIPYWVEVLQVEKFWICINLELIHLLLFASLINSKISELKIFQRNIMFLILLIYILDQFF